MFRRAEDFLWAVRCHMHFVTGRAEERLSFDIQREIAVRLGYTAHPGMRDVERFMKHYFLVAKDVGDLTAILCGGAGGARGEADAGARPRGRAVQAASAPRRARVGRFRRRPQPHQHRGRRMPSAAIRSTSSASSASRRSTISRSIRTRCASRPRSLKLIDQTLREDKTANQLFFEILTSRGRRGRAAPHERGGRARPLRARLRPHRRDDAVQHVPPLHGGRASAALHRHPAPTSRPAAPTSTCSPAS